MYLKVMLLMASVAVIWAGVGQPSIWAMPQQSDAKTASETTTSAAPPSSQDSAKTNWSPVPDFDQSQKPDSLASRWSFKSLGSDLVGDQKDIWTSPSKFRFADMSWFAPFAGASAGLFLTDREYSRHLSANPQTDQHYNDVANAGLGALAGVGGGMALWSVISHDDHQRETGFLAGEAAADSLVVVYALKYATGRQRPYQDDANGHFFRGGDSFPSEHAAAAWAIAGIISHEYPGLIPKIFAYSLATAVSVSKVQSRDHFASDVLVGAGIGWLVSRHVFNAHHDPELGGADWESPRDLAGDSDAEAPESKSHGSPSVPLDSWIYPALERLAALGYVDTAFLGVRPWSRAECALMTQEAGEKLEGGGSDSSEAGKLYSALIREFQPDLENVSGAPAVHLESLYSGTTEIVGRPLNDGYHFGQTIINDFGRPYEQGFNSYDGISGYATAGPFTLYVRGEYEHSPAAPAYSESVRQVIATMDANPLQPGTPIAGLDQTRLLDTYVAANYSGWNMSFGKESLWWGPGEGSAFTISDNAQPLYMFRVNRIVPTELPGFLHWLGPMKVDTFFGKLSGNEFPRGPFMHGEKISFKPTRNFEWGFTRTVELGGVGRPLTLDRFFRSYFVIGYVDNATSANDPGVRTGGFDIAYRLPRLRDWVTVYFDGIYRPIKAGVNPGIYINHFPKLAKLDLRLEAVQTGNYLTKPGEFVYYDGFYHDFYTNHSNLLGSWVGRQGEGVQGWSNYWLSPRNRLQVNYRHQKVSANLVPDGGTLTDVGVRADWWVRPTIGVSTQVQYEVWNFPVIQTGNQRDISSSIQITITPPGGWFERKHPGSADGRSFDASN
jgi:hypothetical protein